MVMNKLAICYLLLATAFAASGAFNYTNFGDDWTGGDCPTGTEQSPIDFITKIADELPDSVAMGLDLNYNVFSGDELSLTWPDDHAALVSRGGVGQTMGSFTGKIAASWTRSFTFDLAQFHFHVGSEHLINGKRYALEMHQVHLTDDVDNLVRPYAVIGTLFEEGDENEFLKNLIENNEVDFSKQWPADSEGNTTLTDWMYYEGGLTTPNCLQVVNWFLWPKVQEASKEQIEYLGGFIDIDGNALSTGHETYRNVVPLGERNLYYFESRGDWAEDFGAVLSLAVAALFFF